MVSGLIFYPQVVSRKKKMASFSKYSGVVFVKVRDKYKKGHFKNNRVGVGILQGHLKKSKYTVCSRVVAESEFN